MIRAVTVAAVLVLIATALHQAFALPAAETPAASTQTVVLTSTETPLPTAPTATVQPPATPGPTQIAFVGRVSADAGTVITVSFFDVATAKGVVCGSAVTTPVSDPKQAAFALLIDATCSDGRQDPKFCWGQDACHFFFDFPVGKSLGGTTFDLGLITADPREAPHAPSVNDADPAVGLPQAGGPGESSYGKNPVIPAAGIVLLTAGGLLGCAAFVRSKRHSSNH